MKLLFPFLCLSGLSQAFAQVYDVAFAQLDWYFPTVDDLAIKDSSYGQFSWSYTPDTTLDYFLNLFISVDGSTSYWAVQNLPLFAVDDASLFPGGRSEGVYFDIMELGLSEGEPLEKVFFLELVDTMALPGPVDWEPSKGKEAWVESLKRAAFEYPGGADPEETGGPYFRPKTVKVGNGAKRVNKPRKLNGVQELGPKCTAGSFARSLDWLNREHKLNFPKTAKEIYDDLIKAGVSDLTIPNKNGIAEEWIVLKNTYARLKSNNRIVTKAWGQAEIYLRPTPNVKQEFIDFKKWLKREIPTADVEVSYKYYDNGGFTGHVVTVAEVFCKGDDMWIKYRDDDDQGNDNKGDGKGKYPEYKTVKIYKKGDYYRFGGDRFFIYRAVSESFTKEGGAKKDPHFQKWDSEWFDYQGQCDLVLASLPSFSAGLGLTVHIRTKIRFSYSFIESVAIRIGEDVLEVCSFGEYFLNGVDAAAMPSILGLDFPVTHTVVDTKKHEFDIQLSETEHILVSTFKDMVSVQFNGATDDTFADTVGMMGDFGTGRMLARDGTTVIEDPNDFGQEWQVLASEPVLFQVRQMPQYPQRCVLPDPKSAGRRLGESIARSAAEAACAHWDKNKEAKEACIFDVMATGDLEVAEAN